MAVLDLTSVLCVGALTRIFSALSEKTDSQGGLLPSSQSGSSNCKIEDSEKTNVQNHSSWESLHSIASVFSLEKKERKKITYRVNMFSQYTARHIHFAK